MVGVFVSYAWDGAEHNSKVAGIAAALRASGDFDVFLDVDGGIANETSVDMAAGLDACDVVCVMLTSKYMAKANSGNRADNVFCEFEYATSQRANKIVVVVMDAALRNVGNWVGSVGLRLSGLLYEDMVEPQQAGDVTGLTGKVRNVHEGKAERTRTGPLFRVNMDKVSDIPRLKATEYVDGTRLWIYRELQSNWLDVAAWSQVFVLLGYAGIGKSVCLANICERGHAFDPPEVHRRLLGNGAGAGAGGSGGAGGSAGGGAARRKSKSLLQRLSRSAKSKNADAGASELDFVVPAMHFFKHDDSELRNGKNALVSIARQLCDSVPGFFDQVRSVQEGFDVSKRSLLEVFRELLSVPLKAMRSQPTQRAFVVVDALDECHEYRKEFLHLLQTEWQEEMPKWLGVLVSSRPESYIPPKLSKYAPTTLDTEDEANVADMKLYLEVKLQPFLAKPSELDAAVELLLGRSKGLFLYARFIEATLAKAGEGALTLAQIQDSPDFPPGLDGYYERYFRRFLEDALDGDAKLYETLLGAMCAARAPLPVADTLPRLLGKTPRQVTALVKKIQQLLMETDGDGDGDGGSGSGESGGRTVRFVHKSMSDFLLSEDTDEDLAVDVEAGHAGLATYVTEFRGDAFAAKHGLYHLCCVGDFATAGELTCDFEWVSGVLVDHRVAPRAYVQDCVDFVLPHAEALLHAASEAKAKAKKSKSSKADEVEAADAVVTAVRCVEKSLFALEFDPRELASQVLGRIAAVPPHPLRESLPATLGFSWLRPLQPTLTLARDPLRRTLHGDERRSITALVGDGPFLYSASEDRAIKFWDKRTGECVRSVQEHPRMKQVRALAVSGPYLFSGCDDQTVRVFDKDSGDVLRTIQVGKGFITAACASAGKSTRGSDATGIVVFAASRGDLKVRGWNADTGELLCTMEGHTATITSLALVGKQVVSASVDKTLRVFSQKDGKCVRVLSGHESWVNAVAADADMIVSGSNDKTVKVWDVRTGDCKRTLEGHTSYVFAVAVNSTNIFSGSDETLNNGIRVWDKATGECVRALSGTHGLVLSLVVDRDAFFSGSDDNSIKLWDLSAATQPDATAAGATSASVNKHEGAVTSIGILEGVDDQGRTVAVSFSRGKANNVDNTARRWDCATGEFISAKPVDPESAATREFGDDDGGMGPLRVSSDLSTMHVQIKTTAKIQVEVGFTSDDGVWRSYIRGHTMATGTNTGTVHLLRIEDA